MTSGRAWSLISLGDDRQYGGNAGYDDVPQQSYQYDSRVPNHTQLEAGHLVFLRDRSRLLGVALVQAVTSAPGEKPQRHCPVCNSTALKERRNTTPRWRCGNGHTFAEPIESLIPVTVYKAEYGNTYVRIPGHIAVSVLKTAALRPSDQLSIEEVDARKMEAPLLQNAPDAKELFARFVQQWRPAAEDAGDEPPAATASGPFTPSQTDMREVLLRSIRARRGQAGFRRKLIRRYGPRCMVSGCSVLDIVEAAHIWPYRGSDDNHLDNGILLRADLHTLFDLDLLGVDPDTLAISVHPSIAAEGYGPFEGTVLATNLHQKPARDPLVHRWTMFAERLKAARKLPVPTVVLKPEPSSH